MMIPKDIMNSGRLKQIEKGNPGKRRKRILMEIEGNLSIDIDYILAHYPLH